MSRFTASILMATALLGVLLWIVVSMAIDFARAPETPLPLPQAEQTFPDSWPRINSRDELIAFLAPKIDTPEQLVRAGEQWFEERGYPAGYRFLTSGVPQNDVFAATDDAELLILAGNGDLDAMHELAERSLHDRRDPLEALAWYDRAIVNGSLYAMLRVADLIATLTDPALAGFTGSPEWEAAVAELNNTSPPPVEQALAWSIAAVIMGGRAILDDTHAQRIELLAEKLGDPEIYTACETAQQYVLDAASSRRAKGGAVFALEQPPFALSVAYSIPCSIPVVSLVTLDECATDIFVGPGPQEMIMHRCTQ